MAKKRGNKLDRRIRRTGRKVRRLNQKIGGLKPNEDAKRTALVAKRDAVKKRRGKLVTRRGNQLLSDPNRTLKGKNLSRAARQATRLTTEPHIRAKRNEIRLINRQTNRDVGKLNRMGDRLKGEMQGLSANAQAVGLEAYGRAETSASELNQRLADNSQRSVDRNNQLQSSVLGGQISSLQSANINPAASGSAGIMAQFAQAGQNATSANAQASQNLGATMGAANLANVAAGNASTQAGLTRSALDIQRNIMNRVSDRQAAGSDARLTARSELATLKGLRGAELVNQLMKLRGTERDWMSEQQRLATERYIANTQASAKQQELAIKGYDAETKRIGVNNKGSGGSGSGGGENLGRADFRGYRSIAEDIRKGNPITDWGKFLDAVGKTKGVNWSARQRRQFKRRYKKWLGKKGKK